MPAIVADLNLERIRQLEWNVFDPRMGQVWHRGPVFGLQFGFPLSHPPPNRLSLPCPRPHSRPRPPQRSAQLSVRLLMARLWKKF